MITAYEKFLVNQSYKLSEIDEKYNNHENNIASMLFLDCQEQNPQAFDLVEKVGHDGFTEETFKIAARLVIKNVFEK
jgi:NAD kinase